MSEVMIAVLPSSNLESPKVAERNTHSSSSSSTATILFNLNNSLPQSQPPKPSPHSMIEGSIEEEKREDSHLASLTPFRHQVAGSGALIKVDKGKVYKPLINRELEIYESLQAHPTLLPFVPTFHGTVDLDSEYLSSLQWRNKNLKSEKEDKEKSSIVDTTDKDKNTDIHPWSKLMHSKQKDFLKNEIHSSSSLIKSKQRYLILQDLTFGFQQPCILDIKMGTRQFGDNASESKRLSKEAKRIATTSSTLGIRLCGMQVYCPSTKQYLYFDKYEKQWYQRRVRGERRREKRTEEEANHTTTSTHNRYIYPLYNPIPQQHTYNTALHERGDDSRTPLLQSRESKSRRAQHSFIKFFEHCNNPLQSQQ
eukprot:TRINITY_DN1925_c0_g1_i1.p2 TRINITY_DN1925_c0_g1~~TRINITY_DN1925_c0_g1_i1.p2  ORF type:complete len:366 (+),score=75.21 TRINITY_DN1925_c0_g1_i1:150-1247(+)